MFKVIRNAENYAEIQITTDKNTWSHQRRKRREVFKDKEDPTTKDDHKTVTMVVDETLIINQNSDLSHSEISNVCSLQSPHLQNVLSASDHSETIPENSEIKGSTSDCTHIENKDGSDDTVSLQNTSTFPLTVPQKRKIEDEENVECPSSQKFKTEDRESTKSIESSSVPPQPQTSSQIKSDSQVSSDGAKIGMDLKDKQSPSVVFEPKSLLFSTLKIRKGEDHLLLEMNCLPDANRESMHQIFQFLKNKLATG